MSNMASPYLQCFKLGDKAEEAIASPAVVSQSIAENLINEVLNIVWFQFYFCSRILLKLYQL
jgi:hypothetical protein